MKISNACRWLLLGCALAATTAPVGPWALAHEEPSLDQFKELDEPDTAKKRLAKEKEKRPFDFFRSQVAPFDATPFVKPHHWSTLSLEMRANLGDYDGILETAPVGLFGMPRQVVYRRGARLVKEQQARLGFQVMLPKPGKELPLELTRPDLIRPDGGWSASLQKLEPHQMVVLVLAREPGAYMPWRRLQAILPPTRLDLGNGSADSRLYYRLALPLDPGKPLVSPHPLTWTTISHVIWDGLAPDALNPQQQQAMLDWLHWGGQLTICAGAGPTLAPLRESFLGPYLPADPTGENAMLAQADLTPMSLAYPPPATPADWPDLQAMPVAQRPEPGGTPLVRYRPPVPIRPEPKRPVFLTGLAPREGASSLPLGDGAGRLIGAEWRVGRGRVTLLGFRPTDPAFASWPGLDTMVRRLVLRRVEDTPMSDGDGVRPLSGPELTWVRYLSRDLGAVSAEVVDAENPASGLPTEPVGAWLDSAQFPKMSRRALEYASGVSIPGKPFVLKVILAYSIALVPLNWLLCRYVLRRRELAWVAVPILAIGFAVAVERGAANELGFDSASDEIDLLEVQGGYPRAHLSRCVALYSTGRVKFTAAFPGEPSALALPLDTEGSLIGDEVTQTVWNSTTPALEGFLVQPRSLAMYRSEQMTDLQGSIVLASASTPRRIQNRTDLEIRDAMLVEKGSDPIPLGTIPPGGSVVVGEEKVEGPRTPAEWTDPAPFLKAFQDYSWGRPEDQGEIRLVAWADGARRGQVITPGVDRTRGLTLVVVHLRHGAPPGPDGPAYDGGMKTIAREAAAR